MPHLLVVLEYLVATSVDLFHTSIVQHLVVACQVLLEYLVATSVDSFHTSIVQHLVACQVLLEVEAYLVLQVALLHIIAVLV